MAWIPVNQRSTGWYLFNKLFHVRINPRQVRTADDIKLFGTPTTGNEDFDREMDKAEHVVMWPISQMEAHFSGGYNVKLVKREECAEIYTLISNHLSAMRNLTVESENSANSPEMMDELIRLDRFAEAVFSHARYGLRDNLQHAGYARRAKARDRFASLADLIHRGETGQPAANVVPSNSSVGRNYGTAEDLPAPIPETGLVPLDPIVEDPRLPKRVSLAQMFEERKNLGSRWT
jgi:hypothetical protein